MKKIINNPKDFVDEALEGILYAYQNQLTCLNGDKRIILNKNKAKNGKVSIVTAGGSGHLPMFLGYVGQGMLDGCVAGNVFASPSAKRMADMIRACDHGNGVLCLFGNYGGDKMNFEMACDMVGLEGIKTRIVTVNDDVASSSKAMSAKRRGVAGMVYAFKVASAAAESLKSLDEVANVTEYAINNIRSMGVALSPCILPEVGEPSFHINDNEIEVGMGIHGEPGIEVCPMMNADEITKVILDKIDQDMPLKSGDEVSVLINGLGATPLEELLIVYRKVYLVLKEKGVTVFMPHVGEFATSMEMAGFSITIFKLDEQLKYYLSIPANTPFYTNLNK